MLVKKLMEKRMLRGVSLGKTPVNQTAQSGSCSRSFRLCSPIFSARSCSHEDDSASPADSPSAPCVERRRRELTPTPSRAPSAVPGDGMAHLEEDLDEDSGAGGGVVLRDPDAVQDTPRDGVGGQEVGEELGHIAQLVGLQAMHKGVLLSEALLVQGLPHLVVPAVPLSQQPIIPAQYSPSS